MNYLEHKRILLQQGLTDYQAHVKALELTTKPTKEITVVEKHGSCQGEPLYMNEATGSTGTYDEWYYENEEGEKVNAVDLGEVTEVIRDGDGYLIAAKVRK